MVRLQCAGLAGSLLLLQPLPPQELRRHDRVHHNVPRLAHRCRRQLERAVRQVEGHLELVLREVRLVPVLERDGNVVEEVAVGPREWLQREPTMLRKSRLKRGWYFSVLSAADDPACWLP